jgi:hypothetical protein
VSARNGRSHPTPVACTRALDYAALGWHVLPVGHNKRPLGGQGLSFATTDEEIIRGWWARWPHAQVAIACKPSGLVVIDLDVGHADGANGIRTFREVTGIDPDSAPLVASTPKEGRHLYHAEPAGAEIRSRTGVLPGVDVKAGGGKLGGYVIAPCGKEDRQWISGDPLLDRLTPLPDSLVKLLDEKAPRKRRNQAAAVSTASRHPVTHERTTIASALYAIPPWVSRDEWIRAIFAVHAACAGDSYGAELVEEWSAKTGFPDQYREGEATEIYDNATLPGCAKNRKLTGPGTLFGLARTSGWGVAGVFDPVGEAASPPHPFPVSAFPRNCRAMIEEGSAAQGVDPAYWAVPLLGVLAGSIGATRTVEIKDGWEEPCVLWLAIVAPSGAGKSPPLRALLKPVRDHDHTLHKNYVLAQKTYEADLASWKKNRQTNKSAPKPTTPPLLAAIVNDITLEALVSRLADNPRGLLLCTDELAGWLRSFDRYRNGGGDEQSWLSIHNADDVKVDRKGSSGSPQRVYVRHAAVSILGTIQPEVAKKYIGSPDARASGLAARILLAAPPVKAVKWTDRKIPQKVRERYGDVTKDLLSLELDKDRPRAIPLDPQAHALFVAYHDENGEACLEATRSGQDDLAAVLAKLRGAAARIALVLALARAAESGDAARLESIDSEAMEGGIAIARYFEAEARRLYAGWRQGDEAQANRVKPTNHKDIETKLREILRQGEQSRDDIRNAFGRNVEAAAIGEALEVMQVLGEADCRHEETGGRPREVWFLREGDAHE